MRRTLVVLATTAAGAALAVTIGAGSAQADQIGCVYRCAPVSDDPGFTHDEADPGLTHNGADPDLTHN
jgi:hypothetical protein